MGSTATWICAARGCPLVAGVQLRSHKHLLRNEQPALLLLLFALSVPSGDRPGVLETRSEPPPTFVAAAALTKANSALALGRSNPISDGFPSRETAGDAHTRALSNTLLACSRRSRWKLRTLRPRPG